MRIAFVTHAGLPELHPGDRLAARALEARGAHVAAVAWDDAAVRWEAFDLVVVRSTWDYHLRVDAFLAWVARLEASGVPLQNPPAVLRWNARKTYLRDVAARGARVVPTHWAAVDDPPLGEVLARHGWSRAVAKPVVSASAHRTWVASPDDGADGERRWREALGAGPMMVQPFVEAIVTRGEWSLVFLGGDFSHAVLKRPAPGDFRVQQEHGGTAEPCAPSPRLVAQAAAALALAPAPCLYARIDGYEDDAGLVLLELELLEPSLFLSRAAGGVERFAEAIVRVAVGTRDA